MCFLCAVCDLHCRCRRGPSPASSAGADGLFSLHAMSMAASLEYHHPSMELFCESKRVILFCDGWICSLMQEEKSLYALSQPPRERSYGYLWVRQTHCLVMHLGESSSTAPLSVDHSRGCQLRSMERLLGAVGSTARGLHYEAAGPTAHRGFSSHSMPHSIWPVSYTHLTLPTKRIV